MSGLSPWPPWPGILLASLGAFLMAALLTEPLRRLALRRGYTDHPDARKSHSRPTPYLGGVAVACATLAAAIMSVLLTGEDAERTGGTDTATVGIILTSAALIAVLGLTDDLRPLGLGIGVRLGVEGAAALVVVLCCGHPVFLGAWFDVPFAVGWILFTTNAFNLLDNMDGVVSTVTTVIAGFLCCAALGTGHAGAAALMAALTGACAGFLIHNWHPARIFLGDAGSLFVGFLVSCTTLLHGDGGGTLSGYAALPLVTLVVIADTALVMVARRRAGRPVLQGGRDHIAHRLRRLGLTVRQVAVVIGGFASLTCLIAFLVMFRVFAQDVALITVVAATAVAWGLLLRVPVYESGWAGPAAPAGRPE
ncbi:glycosyltransferase family 4 protein [Streptomyces sp. NPDC127084]|uniref:glycosyltransferase family 4 protein n=1 Tax=Streptomyces sp. NPDC127084 TaxID=3347133 RepID=UPI0036645192